MSVDLVTVTEVRAPEPQPSGAVRAATPPPGVALNARLTKTRAFSPGRLTYMWQHGRQTGSLTCPVPSPSTIVGARTYLRFGSRRIQLHDLVLVAAAVQPRQGNTQQSRLKQRNNMADVTVLNNKKPPRIALVSQDGVLRRSRLFCNEFSRRTPRN